MTAYVLAADGACSGNPGPGGWAFALFSGEAIEGNELVSESGSSADTTNNIMELRACAAGLRAMVGHPAGAVALHFDSEYVLKGIFEWMAGWKARGWKTGAKKPVANRELWVEIDELLTELRADGFEFSPNWVKGHAGDYANELVDTMAQKMRDAAKLDFNLAEDTRIETLIRSGNLSREDVVDLPAVVTEPENLVGIPFLKQGTTAPLPPAEAPKPEIGPMQVELMRTILGNYASGDWSVKKVIEEVRANAIALGCR